MKKKWQKKVKFLENRNGVSCNGITELSFKKSLWKSYLTFAQNCTILSVGEKEEKSRAELPLGAGAEGAENFFIFLTQRRKARKGNYASPWSIHLPFPPN